MKREVLETSYAIQMDAADFLALWDHEQVMTLPARQGREDMPTVLSVALEGVKGVSRVDYNPHFGPNIVFSVDAGYDNDKTHERVVKIIQGYLDRALKAEA